MVHKREVVGWLKNPTTQKVIQCLVGHQEALRRQCGSGGCLPAEGQNATLEQLYFEFQGMLSALDSLGLESKRPFVKLLEDYGYIGEDDDE